MVNPRKNKILYTLWLTEAEEESVKEISKDKNNLDYYNYESVLGEMLQRCIKRGDLKKK